MKTIITQDRADSPYGYPQANEQGYLTSSKVSGPFGNDSVISASYALTASYALNAGGGGGTTNTGSLLLTASAAGNTITFTKGNGTTFPVTVSGTTINTGSFVTTSSFNAFTASYNTGSFSGSFIGTLFGTASWAQNVLTASAILGGKAPHIPYFITDTTLATSSLYQSGSTSVIINLDVNTTANPEALFVWQPSQTSFNVISGKGNLDNYLQLNIQNVNSGPTASSDVVATANNGNESINYIDMGINGENFQGDIGGPNDTYLYSAGRHMHIGTVTNYPIQFFAGGFNSDANRKFELNTNNRHSMTGSLEISGSLTVLGGITGSLFGTASWARNAITASYVAGANVVGTVTSASYAFNASNADNATFASTAGNGGVTNIVAGSGISLIPSSGVGSVTVVSTGVGGVTIISGSNVTQSFNNATTWTFNHNLQTRVPVITVFDTSYNQIIPLNIELTNTASATITFPVAVSGFAIASVGGSSATALSASYALIAEYANTASYYAETDPVFIARSASLATTGSNTFRGIQIISGSGINTILQVHGANAEPWAFGIYNDTYNPAQSVLAGFVDNTGEASIGTEVNKPLYIYTNANYGNPTLIISSSGVTIDNTLTVNNGITGSLFGTASYANNANLLDGKDSTIFATTGSNTFRGNQTITGSLTVSGSGTFTNIGPALFTGSVSISGSTTQTGNNTLIGNTVLSGSIGISGSSTIQGTTAMSGSLSISGSTTQTGNNTLIGNTVLSGSIGISGSQTFYGTSAFYGNHTLSGSNTIIGNTVMSGSIDVSGSSNFHNSVFIVTGSTFIKGTTQITGSTGITGSFSVRDGDINIVSGSSFTRWGNKLFNYGQFSDTSTQSGSANTAYAMKFNTTDFALNTRIVSSSRITVDNTGIYNLQFSAQLGNTANSTIDFDIWFAYTGSNIANSNTNVTVNKVAGSNGRLVAAWNFATPIAANDYVEIYWSCNDSTGQIQATGTQTAPARPAIPSVIATLTQIA